MTKLDRKKSRDVALPTKVHLVKAMVFPVVMYACESWTIHTEEGWVPKNWCFWTVVLEKTLVSPSDSKIKPVNPKGNQPWIFIGRTNAEAEAPILWPPDAKSWLTGNDRDAGKDWKQEEKGTTDNKMLGWHPRLNGHEFEQGPGDGEGQGSLVCCSPWGHRELDRTEWLNSNKDCLLKTLYSKMQIHSALCLWGYWRTNDTRQFYIKDLSVVGVGFPWGCLKPVPQDTEVWLRLP